MKKFTRYLSLAVALVLLVQMLPLQAAAAQELTFALQSGGDSYTVAACDAAAQVLTIPDTYEGKPVTSISSYAFAGCAGLTELTIPQSITYIGGGAFSDCTALKNVYYAGTQSQWGAITVDGGNEALLSAALHCTSGYAFAYEIKDSQVTVTGGNTATGELVIPDVIEGHPVVSIGSYAFRNCAGLTKLVLGSNVARIESAAFENCTGLTELTIPQSVTTIRGGAFSNCTAIENVYYTGSRGQWDRIGIEGGNDALLSAQLHCRDENPLGYQVTDSGVIITGCRTSVIGELEIPVVIDGYTVTAIGDSAFANCTGLTGIIIPAGVTDISVRAFDGCSNLVQIRVDAGNLTYSADEMGVLYNKTKTELILAPKGIQGSFMIPGSVTEIAHRAFAGCTGLNGITIPKNVKNIGSNAFFGCDALENVYYTGSQSQWNAIAIHSGNDALLSAALHCEDDNPLIYEIKSGFVAITGCDRFVTGELEIPVAIEGYPVTAIGDFAFAYCAGLTAVSLPGSLTEVGESIFHGCSALRNVTLGEGITEIFGGMFRGCTGLTTFTVPESVTAIGEYAFEGCSKLTEITIPAGVTDMALNAFRGCVSLTGIWVDEGNFDYSGDAQGLVYDQEKRCLLLAPQGIQGSVTIPEGVKEIGGYAFGDCAGLTQITIPKSITKIGYSAFLDCAGLKTVYYGGSRQQWNAIAVEAENAPLTNALLYCDNPFSYEVKGGRATITGCDTSVTGELEIPSALDGYPVAAIGESAFQGCAGLTGITVPAGITDIHVRAFDGCDNLAAFRVDLFNSVYCSDDTGVVYNKAKTQLILMPKRIPGSYTVPGSVTTIGSYAFRGCAGLTELVIPESVVYILEGAFQGCTGLQDVYYAGTEQQFSAIVLEDHNEALLTATLHSKIEYPFSYWVDSGKVTIGYCDVSASGALTIPQFIDGYPVTAIEDGAFAGCTDLTEVVLPRSLTEIGLYAFDGCEGLTRLAIPGSLQRIGEGAFALCTGLEEVVIESGVQTIGLYAFESCTALKTVTIPESVTVIEEGAFYDCSALEDVHYAGTRQQWDEITVDIDNEYLRNAAVHCKVFAQLEDGTLQLLNDAALQALTVQAGQVLDLNGHILTVESLASFGQIVDRVGGGGLIAGEIEMSGNAWLPIQDSEGCYRFYEYRVTNLGTRVGADKVSFGFTLDFGDMTAYSALLQSEDVQITVSLAWDEEIKTFAFSKELVAQYVQLLAEYPMLRPYLRLNVTGLDSLAPGTQLTVTPAVTAVGGKLHNIGPGMTYTA